jgi:RNA polymerase sigma-70 factor, ECF subfamily
MFEAFKSRKKDEIFEEELNKVINLLYSVALRMTRNREDAQDLVQEATLRAYNYFGSFKLGTNFKAWSVKILRSIFINNYHKKKREPYHVSFDDVSNFVSLPEITGVEEEILQEKLHYAVDSLPEDLRIALTLFYLENFSYKDIANIMDIPIGTVMSRLYTARQLLKRSLFVYDRKKEQ